jgi:hypothetical protein
LRAEVFGDSGGVDPGEGDDEEEVLMTKGAVVESLCLNPYGKSGIRYREEFFKA